LILPRFAACVAVLFAATSFAQPNKPAGAELEQILKSADRAELQTAFARISKEAGSIDPLYVMLMAGRMHQFGQNEEAVFWFLAGQLRMRYLLIVSPDSTRSQAFGSIMFALATIIYEPFQNDMAQLAPVVDRVLAWDKVTPVDFSWQTNRNMLPREQWEAKFAPVREGLLKLKAEFLAIPKDECERIDRDMGNIDYKKRREQSQAGWASEFNRQRVEAGFSTAATTVITDGIAFRTTKNHLSPFAFPDSHDYRDREIGFILFLPELSGYTRENWSELMHPQMLQANVLPNSKYNFMSTFAEQAAMAGPVLREVNGLKIHSRPGAHKCFPEELGVGVQADGEPVFVNCLALKTPYPACIAYFYGQEKAYHVSMRLTPERLPEWRELIARVKKQLAAWQHAAR